MLLIPNESGEGFDRHHDVLGLEHRSPNSLGSR